MTTNIDKISDIDRPSFEWTKLAPVLTGANTTAATCSDGSKFIYYLSGTNFYRYDTITDTWQQLASCPVAPVNDVCLRYDSNRGYYGRVVDPTKLPACSVSVPNTFGMAPASNSFYAAGLDQGVLNGYTIEIYSGTGCGQTAIIKSVDAPVIFEYGEVVSNFATQRVSDTTAAIPHYVQWVLNQWRDYQVRVMTTGGGGYEFIRKILHNNNTDIYYADALYLGVNPWANPYCGALLINGYPFTIEASKFTLDRNWDVTPDTSSKFVIKSGGIWMMTVASLGHPTPVFYYYDIAADTWYSKSNFLDLDSFETITSVSMALTSPGTSPLTTGTVTSTTSRRIVNSGAAMTQNQYANMQIKMTSGKASGLYKTIIANDATSFTLGSDWQDNNRDVAIVSGDTYLVQPDTDKIWFMMGSQSTLGQYSIDADMWSVSPIYDYGMARDIAIIGPGAITGIATAYANSSYIVGDINNTVTIAAGTGYNIGDVLTVTGGGGNAKLVVTSVSSIGGVVSAMPIVSGSGYGTSGTGVATTVVPNVGVNCTVSWSNTTGVLTYAPVISNYQLGDRFNITGCSNASFNTTYIDGGNTSYTWLDMNPYVAGTPAAANSSGTGNATVDASKNWANSEHVGKINVQNDGSSYYELQTVTTNTATKFTSGWADEATVANAGRFIICDPRPFGNITTLPQVGVNTTFGVCSSADGTGNTITDSSKSWTPNWWSRFGAYTVVITSGTGAGSSADITSNTATVITLASNIPNDTSTAYSIYAGSTLVYNGNVTTGNGTGNTITDIFLGVVTYEYNAGTGRRVLIVAGLGAGQTSYVTSNTSTALTLSPAISGGTDTTTVYEIQDCYGNMTNDDGLFFVFDTAQNFPAGFLTNREFRCTTGRHFGTNRNATIVSNTFDGFVLDTDLTSINTGGQNFYSIYPITPRGNGQRLEMDATCQYLYSFAGGQTSEIDRYSITQGVWDVVQQSPNFETLGTGSMYAYDGVNRIYFTKDATGRLYYYDITTGIVSMSGTIPDTQGTSQVGNRMEIVTFPTATALDYPKDKLRYLYIMRHSPSTDTPGNRMWRMLILR